MTSSRMIATSKPETCGSGSFSATRCQARYPKLVVFCTARGDELKRSDFALQFGRLGVESGVPHGDTLVVRPLHIGSVGPCYRRSATPGVALVEDLEQIALHELLNGLGHRFLRIA